MNWLMMKPPCMTPHWTVHKWWRKHFFAVFLNSMACDSGSQQKPWPRHYLVRTPACAAPSSAEWSPCTAECRPSCAGTMKQKKHKRVLALRHADAVHSPLLLGKSGTKRPWLWLILDWMRQTLIWLDRVKGLTGRYFTQCLSLRRTFYCPNKTLDVFGTLTDERLAETFVASASETKQVWWLIRTCLVLVRTVALIYMKINGWINIPTSIQPVCWSKMLLRYIPVSSFPPSFLIFSFHQLHLLVASQAAACLIVRVIQREQHNE